MEELSIGDIALIIISGLGVIHGLLLGVFLFFHKRGSSLSNQLLGFLLFVLSFRVGKSVLLEFAQDLHVKIIFIGLASMLLIGPLFYLFSKSLLLRSFSLRNIHFLHFLPAIFGICFGFWIEEIHLRSFPLWVFVVVYAFYYGHYISYIVFSYRAAVKAPAVNSTNYQLLRLIFFGLLAIWFVYSLNLFDEDIPYIIGPILYSIVAYSISFLVIKNRFIDKVEYEKYKSTQIPENLGEQIYLRIQKLMVEEKGFKNPDLTLKFLGEHFHQSPQIISMVINRKSGKNFNSFINYYRIEESIKQLRDSKFEHYTISAIAMESGFNSLSSFNTAFKKQTGSTPLAFRNMR
ncbi:helix-turn-helix domain-containing protein [Algoriphagus antarcticus]|uniref:AraC family transcriptional regulator n=1 Tax=Algoriphagus antarcticus TaxID=238540 RepID=A0A3E0E365_9BACT|nr:helix-turn-helix transcriptional regulator [Algoriphagus antarcticus]REG92668.1 AraC family transcriptional regulator [Algoriphagus antarcticus]